MHIQPIRDEASLSIMFRKGTFHSVSDTKEEKINKYYSICLCISICPVCLKPDDGEIMVLCEVCKEWFHKECVPSFNENNNNDWI